MEDSIFTRIIQGEIPCHKVYEDAQTFAFLDIHPIQPGHVLVVPKAQVGFVWDLPAPEYAALMKTVQKVGRRIREVTGAPYVGEQIMGTDVPHAHVHVFPFAKATEFRNVPDGITEPDHSALANKEEKLRMEDEL